MDYLREYLNDKKTLTGIQAGFALNAGKLLAQYDRTLRSLPKDQQYDATLTISVLQAVAANCVELLDSYEKFKPTRDDLNVPLLDIPQRFGIGLSIVKHTYYQEMTYAKVIRCIRHSLSHPNYLGETSYPMTGFRSVPDKNGEIVAYLFIHSPLVKLVKNVWKPKMFSEKDIGKQISKYSIEGGSIGLTSKARGELFEITLRGMPYVPRVELEIPLATLKVFTRELCNYLAQPVIDKAGTKWDCKTVHALVA